MRYHAISFEIHGVETVKRIMSWRSKRGQRRLSNDAVKKVLDKGMKQGSKATRNEIFDIVKTALAFCPVKIANDQE